MPDDTQSTRFSLRRWSQRKHAAAHGRDAAHDDVAPGKNPPAKAEVQAAAAKPDAGAPGAMSAVPSVQRPVQSAPAPAAAAAVPPAAIPLPALESLTIDSDFSPFMQAGVDEDLKRSALRKLLRHPRFNVMDGLDVYIDDYSIPSPLEPELVRTLAQARYIFDPPKVRVTADGIAEDVPDDVEAALDDGPESGVCAPVTMVTPAPEAIADQADARVVAVAPDAAPLPAAPASPAGDAAAPGATPRNDPDAPHGVLQ